MDEIYIAFYKGNRDKKDGLAFYYRAKLSDWLIRVFTKGPYSHAELAVPLGEGQYRCYTSSIRDGGVRVKNMPLPEDKWDLIPISKLGSLRNDSPETIEAFFESKKGLKYDFLGALGIILPTQDRANKWFCSEIIAEYFGIHQSWRYSPNLLWSIMQNEVK